MRRKCPFSGTIHSALAADGLLALLPAITCSRPRACLQLVPDAAASVPSTAAAVGEFVVVRVGGDETPAEVRGNEAQIAAPSRDKTMAVRFCSVRDRVANAAD